MAVEALESGFTSSQLVAGGATCNIVEVLVRARERPGRNLGSSGGGQDSRRQKQENSTRKHGS